MSFLSYLEKGDREISEACCIVEIAITPANKMIRKPILLPWFSRRAYLWCLGCHRETRLRRVQCLRQCCYFYSTSRCTINLLIRLAVLIDLIHIWIIRNGPSVRGDNMIDMDNALWESTQNVEYHKIKQHYFMNHISSIELNVSPLVGIRKCERGCSKATNHFKSTNTYLGFRKRRTRLKLQKLVCIWRYENTWI